MALDILDTGREIECWDVQRRNSSSKDQGFQQSPRAEAVCLVSIDGATCAQKEVFSGSGGEERARRDGWLRDS